MSHKALLQQVFVQLLDEITPEKLVADSLRVEGERLTVAGKTYDLNRYRHVYLLGSGKAVVPMAKAVEARLKPWIAQSLFIGPYSTEAHFHNGSYIQSTHPLPSEKSIEGAEALQTFLKTLHEDDLFIYLLSGGNSALVELPEADITLSAFQEATELMLHSGMPIEQINCVRKHLSSVKGGKLARHTKAQGVVLVLSDVIGDDLYAIGSAPFYADKTDFSDALNALTEYGIFEKMPAAIQAFLQEGRSGQHAETPKIPASHIDHHILGSNRLVLQKAQRLFAQEGIDAVIVDEPLSGDTETLSKSLAAFSTAHQEENSVYIFGGEATVVVKGQGRGGRNQHLCLSLLMQLEGVEDFTFLSAATDGIDGNSNAAGALVDTHSLTDAKTHHLDPRYYLESFDSNSFFAQTGELLITGPTHNNLLDIMIMRIGHNPIQRETHG